MDFFCGMDDSNGNPVETVSIWSKIRITKGMIREWIRNVAIVSSKDGTLECLSELLEQK